MKTIVRRKDFLPRNDDGIIAQGYVLMPPTPKFKAYEVFSANPKIVWIGEECASHMRCLGHGGRGIEPPSPTAVLQWVRVKQLCFGRRDVTVWGSPGERRQGMTFAHLHRLIETEPSVLGWFNVFEYSYYVFVLERMGSGWRLHAPPHQFMTLYSFNDHKPDLDRRIR